MIDGMDNLEKRLRKYENISLKQPVGKAVEFVRGAAVNNCLKSTGELANSIFGKIEEHGMDQVEGICYTNKSYASYVEFGTGPKGQENHAGISPNSSGSYVQSPWWIHESQIEGGRDTAEKYHWFHIDTEEGRFYQCNGQPARPFMYPALKNNEEQVTQIIIRDIRRQIK